MNTYSKSMDSLRRPLVAAAAVLFAGCGACGTTNSGQGATLKLESSQAGGTFTVHIRQAIELTLTNSRPVPGASTTWSADSSNPAVVLRTAIHEKVPTAFVNVTWPVVTEFVAEAAGSANLVAKSQTECEALLPSFCHGPPAMTFHIRVVRD
jgi:hypothetical protein